MTTKFLHMRFRDNSVDDIQYDQLGDEKLLLEQHETETGDSKKVWRGRATITYALILALLLISVVLNVVVLSGFYKASSKHTVEQYGDEST